MDNLLKQWKEVQRLRIKRKRRKMVDFNNVMFYNGNESYEIVVQIILSQIYLIPVTRGGPHLTYLLTGTDLSSCTQEGPSIILNDRFNLTFGHLDSKERAFTLMCAIMEGGHDGAAPITPPTSEESEYN